MKAVKWFLAAAAAFLIGLSFWPASEHGTVALAVRPSIPSSRQEVTPRTELLSYSAAAINQLAPAANPAPADEAAEGAQGAEPAAPAGPDVHDAFARWVEQYASEAWGGDLEGLLSQGEQLARARRAALAHEIQENPRGALEHAVPYRWRQLLPENVTRHFEQRVSGLARYDVFMACMGPGEDHAHPSHTAYRYVTLAGTQYRAFVYGRRVAEMAQPSIPLHGIAIDDLLAVAEEPVRLLETEEAQARSAAPAGALPPNCPICGVTPATPAMLEVAGGLVAVCSPSHGESLSRALMGPGASGVAAANGLPVWTNAMPAAPVPTFGTRRALYLRIVFRDDTTIPISEEQAKDEMEQVNDFYIEASYSKTAINAIITPILTLPQPKAFYALSGPARLMTDAQTQAAQLGYAPEDYQLILARFTPVPGYNWGGLGGGNLAWLQYNGVGLAIHEIGHCYGLGHANSWETRRAPLPPTPPDRFDTDSVIGHDSILGAGDDIEYGDPFDVMGGGGGESQRAGGGSISGFTGHFNPIGKYRLDWLPASALIQSTTSTTNRIHVFDTPVLDSDRRYALLVKKDAQRTYWVSARNRISGNRWITNGVSLHWAAWPQLIGYSTLLDSTPGTVDGKNDGSISLGRTYSDPEAGVHITPIARGGTGGDTWYDVVVNHGAPTNNEPPVVTLNVTAESVAANRPVTFTVQAVDPDGDPLAYYWDISDGSFGVNGPTLTRTWTAEGDYRVRVEVSDMKGHRVSYHKVIRVGSPNNSYAIQGWVFDDKGLPVAGVRVANGGITNTTELGTDFQATFTDSDGSFSLVGQTPGDREVTAFLNGYITKPQNFNQFVRVADQDVVDLQFLAVPQPRVTVKVAQHADLTKGTPGMLTFTRTGDTNSELRAMFVLGGTVKTNDFTAPTNKTTHTNALSTLLANVNLAVPFYLVNFQTGVFQTNLSIKVVTNATATEATLEASVMYALQKQATYMTNIDDGNGGTTNVLATNFTYLTGWEVLTVNNQETWYQTYPEYVVGSPGTATMIMQGVKTTKPVISILALDAAASENAGDSALFTLLRTGLTNTTVTVQLGYGGVGTYDADYEALPLLVVIPAGVTSVSLPLRVRPDLYLEGNETVQISVLPDEAYSVGTAKAEAVIGDNDLPMITVVADDPVASENATDTGSVVVTRIGDLTGDLTVYYLAGGSAVNGRDYRTLSGSVVIPAGQPTATITIQGRNNGLQDGGNTLDILLSDNPTYNIGEPGLASVFIQDGVLPTVSIRANDADAAEPDDVGEFTLTRTGDTRRDLLVQLAVGGTARPVADYGSITSFGRIPAGAASVVVRVTPVNDIVQEDSETIVCQILPSPDYNRSVTLTNQQATVTLADDDGSGQLGLGFTFLDSKVVEGSLTGLVAVSISGNPPPDTEITVDWKLTGGTAVPDLDYPGTNTSGRLVFTRIADSQISNRVQLIPFPILNDALAEPAKSLVFTLVEPAPLVSNEVVTNTITLTNAAGEEIGSTNVLTTNIIITPVPMNAMFDVYSAHTLTIVDDDSSSLALELVTGTAYEEGPSSGLIVLRRTGSTASNQVVRLSVAGSASNGSDYETVPPEVVIPIGEATLEIPIVPVDDPVQEFMESVTVRIAEAPGATVVKETSFVTVNLVDNDGTVEFAMPSYIAYEGSAQAAVRIRRTSNAELTASVVCEASAGSATAADFYPTNSIINFGPGETEKLFYVDLVDDRQVEPPETITLELRNLSDGVPLGGQITASLTLLDNDTQVELLALDVQAMENQSNVAVTIYRYGVVTNSLRVELAAETNGTAVDGLDFVATNYAVVFQPGQTTAVAQVRLLNDVQFDGNKQLPVVVTNIDSTASYGPNIAGQVSIQDDECSVQVAASEYSVDEYGRTLTLTIERNGSTHHPIQVNYATKDDSALATKDYVSIRGLLMFTGNQVAQASDGSGLVVLEAGEASKTLDVRILDDLLGEGDESFYFSVTNARVVGGSGPVGTAVLGSNVVATVKIVDNETPGSLDYEFNPGAGANDAVLGLAQQPDAKLLLAGRFTEVDQVALNRLARLHSDGYLDSFLNPGEGFDNDTYAVAVQSDGRVLVGGAFTHFNGQSVNRIARLSADGLRDPEFNVPGGANAAVRALAVAADGSILMGGDFTSVGGTSRQRLARLQADGSVDMAFSPQLDGAVHAIALQADGAILVGGKFTSVGGGSRAYIARLNADGTRDTLFNPGVGPDKDVYAITLQRDGRIVIAGAFEAVSGQPRAGIARLNLDGSLDTTFETGTGLNGVGYALGSSPDGKILLGGEFTSYNGADRNRIMRLNPNGSLDVGFDVGSGANGTVHTLLVQPDTAVVIGGEFTEVKGLPRNRIARIHGDEKFTVNMVEFAAAIHRVRENAGPVVVTVTRSGDLASSVSLNYFTEDGTARAGEDYQAAQGTLTFDPNVTEQTVSLNILDDALGEGDETFFVNLTNLPPGFTSVARLRSTVYIEDNESAVAFALANTVVDENAGKAGISVRRTGPTNTVVSVEYTTRDGTATAGTDYVAATGTIEFAVGVVEMSFDVEVLDNAAADPDRTVQLELSNPQGGAVLGSLAKATLTITDNDRVDTFALNITPPVGGSVTPPSGAYPAGSTQVLTAVAERGFAFNGWEGTVSSPVNPLTLTMDRDYFLTANFVPVQFTYTFEPPFRASDLVQPPWYGGSTRAWQLQSTVASSGTTALRSGVIGDGQESTIQLTVNSRGGAASFDVRVSSEANWDFAEFYVDGLRVQRWSGEVPWRTYMFNLGPGTHNLAWRYLKDNNYSSGMDAMFIDNIYVPDNSPDPTDPAAELRLVNVPGGFQIWITGKAGLTYVLEQSGDLGTWSELGSYLNSTGTIVIPVTIDPANPAVYFRAVTTP